MVSGTMPANWSSALNGKVAGLSVVSPAWPLGSSRISLRGDVSLNQNGNNALVVVDGVPMSSPMIIRVLLMVPDPVLNYH
jgi:hypothetical protein